MSEQKTVEVPAVKETQVAQAPTGNTSKTNFKKATAFLNVRIQDKAGTWHNLPKGIALYADGKPIEKGLLGLTEHDLLGLTADNRIELSVKTSTPDTPVAL